MGSEGRYRDGKKQREKNKNSNLHILRDTVLFTYFSSLVIAVVVVFGCYAVFFYCVVVVVGDGGDDVFVALVASSVAIITV